MIPATGFAPDADPTSQGVFIDCTNIVPTINGFKAGPSLNDSGSSVLPDVCRGSGLIAQLDNTRRLFAGTPTKVYELIAGVWTDRSRAGGYTSGAENRWRFAQMGNVTLATNQMDVIQASTTAAFSDVAGAPKARIIETVAGFVMALATNDPINGDLPDQWWCSGLYDYTAWTPNPATQAANGRLLGAPGDIRAGRRLGNNMVVYKEKSMFLGTYLGPPIIWAWEQIIGDQGALSQGAVVSIGTAHVFIGADDFWLYDGSRPVPIGAPVRKWFFATAASASLYKTQGYYDRVNALVYWYFVSNKSTSGEIDECLIYNTKTQRWGRASRAIQSTIEFISLGLTFDTMGGKYPTYEDITGMAYDTYEWFASGSQSAVFTPDGKIMRLSGAALPSSITLNDMGDDSQYSTLSRVRVRFLQSPQTGSLQAFFREVEGDLLQLGETATLDDGKFDLLWSARWHRLQMNFTGEMEMNGFAVQLNPDGYQ